MSLPSTDVTFPNPFLIHPPEETQQPFYTYILFSRTYVNELSDEWGVSMCVIMISTHQWSG